MYVLPRVSCIKLALLHRRLRLPACILHDLALVSHTFAKVYLSSEHTFMFSGVGSV